ncbi:triose-phosphate isomerase [Candidatus Shapirobacteria bacterium]|nr:triose-phosphate isomerase [Candidatus Shapirobacteria bacterium]
MLWINFKIYKQSFGEGALKLARACQKVVDETGVKIIPVVSAFDLVRVKEVFSGEVWVQHLDFYFEGKHTGWLSPLQALALGAGGSLLNHSEHKLPPGQIRQTVAYLKRKKWVEHWEKEVDSIEKFKIMVCFGSQGQAKSWLRKLDPQPDFVAYEPAELIGGKVSVAQSQPAMIKNMVELMAGYNLVVGAGVHCAADVKKAIELGAVGVLVSSDVVKAKNPQKELLELALAFGK